MERSILLILEALRNGIERAIYYQVQYKLRIFDADDKFPLEFPEVRGRPWPIIDWLVTRELTRRIDGSVFLQRRKEWFAVKNMKGIEVVLERRVLEYKLLREQKYKLLRELEKGRKTVESGVIWNAHRAR